MYEYIGEKWIKIPCFSLAWVLKNISEFWRNNELKSLNLALGFKKYVRILAKKWIKIPCSRNCERHEYWWILAKKLIKIPRFSLGIYEKKISMKIGEKKTTLLHGIFPNNDIKSLILALGFNKKRMNSGKKMN